MKSFLASMILILTLIQVHTAQDRVPPTYEVNPVLKPLSISKQTLIEAQTLMDLNPQYKASWVRIYKSVEISAYQNGKLVNTTTRDHILSQAQKDLMNKVDVGTDIAVAVRYIPDNTLTHNDVKEFSFKFMVNPETDATFNGGEAKLMAYLAESVMNKIPDGTYKGFDLTAIKFTITGTGAVTNVQLFTPSEHTEIDDLLMKTILNMPRWTPAEYSNGVKTSQEFALTVGNMQNCTVPLLNIRPNKLVAND
jgi:hypothetical protein